MSGSMNVNDENHYYEEAKKIVIQTQIASVSALQRKLGLGYTRAARIMDQLEADGIVSDYQGTLRKVLIKP